MSELLNALDVSKTIRALEPYFGVPIEHVAIEESRPLMGPPGMAGDKVICRVTVHSQSEVVGEVECYIKRMKQGLREANVYHALLQRKLPVPELYGYYLDQQDREVLFLEYLPRIGISYDSEDEISAWISLLARFNATPERVVDQIGLDDRKWGEWLIDDRVEEFSGLLACAARSEIGEKLEEFCRTKEKEIHSLKSFARTIHRSISDMPKALINEELNPAWRDDGTLVGIDMHLTAWAPRCVNLMTLLGEPQLTPISGRGLPDRDRWAAVYTTALSEAGGPDLQSRQVIREAHLLWVAFAFQLTWGLQVAIDGNINWSDDLEHNRQGMRR
ncbi:hypothetical protein HN911_03565 [Candidatus Bathyarchaeota archaeon]|nr:hypothetical protein [Candidatus Bathyarchaeota archaeon]